MSNSNSNKTVSISFIPFSGIFLVFLFLKLAKIGDVANWSWWWVTSPIWGPLALLIAFFIVVFILFLFKEIITEIFKKKK